MGSFIYYFSPTFLIIFIYQSFGELIHHLQPDIDPWLIKIDFLLFGVHPTVWMERWISPFLTELMSFFYGSYYFLPFILILTLYLKENREELNISISLLMLGYYISFIGYILLPAIGPRYTLSHLYSKPLEGGIITNIVIGGLDAIAYNKRDVMPSGHTQISLIVLFLAYQYNRIIFYIYLPIVCGLIFSTIYLRYHYLIDLFVGSLLALICMFIGPRFIREWSKLYRD
ncbi:MAG: phosphatase PAP2 family protein [Thermodesulfobacteriota bacterium]